MALCFLFTSSTFSARDSMKPRISSTCGQRWREKRRSSSDVLQGRQRTAVISLTDVDRHWAEEVIIILEAERSWFMGTRKLKNEFLSLFFTNSNNNIPLWIDKSGTISYYSCKCEKSGLNLNTAEILPSSFMYSSLIVNKYLKDPFDNLENWVIVSNLI